MDKNKAQKIKPLWHKDAKWITGIFLLFFLTVSIMLFNLWKLTAPEVAIDAASLTMASAFSRNGLDNTSEIEEFKQKIIAGGGIARPIPAFDITVTMADLEGRTPRELRVWLFRQIVEPVYLKEAEGLRGKIIDPEIKKNIDKQMGLFKYLNRRTHNKIGFFFKISALVTLAIAGLFAFFSAGACKLFNPGIIFILVGLPGIFLSIVLKNGGGAKGAPEQAENIGQMVSGLMKIIGPQISGIVLKSYATVAITGLVLIVGSVVYRFVRRARK